MNEIISKKPMTGDEPTLFDLDDYAVPDKNPMLIPHGMKKGKLCKGCKFFLREKFHDKSYFKCKIRGVSRSSATDHRVSWNACGLFEPTPIDNNDA